MKSKRKIVFEAQNEVKIISKNLGVVPELIATKKENQKLYSWGRKCQIYAWVEVRNFW